MKIHSVVRSTLILVLALFPTLTVSGEASLSAASASSGQLAFVQAVFDTGLEGASSIALSPDGAHVYVAGYDDAIAVFAHRLGLPAAGAASIATTGD